MAVLPSPYGARGQTPYRFKAPNETVWRGLATVPGFRGDVADLSVECAWDLAPIFARWTGSPLPKPPSYQEIQKIWTGMDRFKELGFHKKFKARGPHQIPAVRDAGQFDYHVLHLPKRFGKAPVSMALGTARGARRFGIFCAGYLKPMWRYEIQKWFPNAKIVYLEGRSGARGRIPGQRRLIKDREELKGHILEADFTICNYDILISHQRRDGAGAMKYLPELLGMGPLLYEIPMDCVILDEAHEAMGYLANRQSLRTSTRGDILAAVYSSRSRCKLMYALTATPTGAGDLGRLWQLFRVLSGSAPRRGHIWGSSHWTFAKRYMDGRYVQNSTGFGPSEIWKADGRTNQKEFKIRMSRIVYSKTLDEVGDGMPRVERIIRKIDPGDLQWRVPKKLTEENKANLMQKAAMYKTVALQPVFKRALEDGRKLLVLFRHKKPTFKLGKELGPWCAKRQIPLITLTGDHPPPDVRDAQCRRIRTLDGGALVACTMDTIRGGLSMGGIDEIHVLELHPKPDVMDQAEGRPLEYGFGKLGPDGKMWLASYYWLVEGTYDDRVAELLLPKLDIIAAVENSDEAAKLRAQLAVDIEQELGDLWDQMAGTVSDEAALQGD